MSAAPHLLIEEDDGIIVCTLNRPEKLNTLTNETMERFEDALHRFRDTPALKVMLIRATGRFFSAGADLREMPGDGKAYVPPRTGSAIREQHRLKTRGMHRIYDEMEHIEKPIVVAHQGTCIGGGLELSLSCDFRLAASSASYAFPEGKMGILPASNGVSRLTRVIGTHWARYMIMANLPVKADRALTIGLVHEVFADESFEADVMEFCRHLSQQNGEQMGTAKIAIEMAMDVGLAQARNVERMANSTLMLNPEYLASYERHVSTIGAKSDAKG